MKKLDLLEAMSDVDQRLVYDAAASMQRKEKHPVTGVLSRVGLAVAGLVAVVVISAVTIPMLAKKNKPDESIPTQSVLQGTQENTVPDTNVNVPAPPSLLRVVALSDVQQNDGAEAEDGVEDSMVGISSQADFWRNNCAVLSFDDSLGKDVTLTSFWNSLYKQNETALQRVDTENVKLMRKRLISLRRPVSGQVAQGLTLDLSQEYAVWGYYNTSDIRGTVHASITSILTRMENVKELYGEEDERYLVLAKRYEDHYASYWGNTFGGLMLDANEDIMSYIVRNDDGEITAVGAVYAYHKHLIENEDHVYYENVVLTRYADLGCVRFDTPVTEEDAQEVLLSLYGKRLEAKESMDFTPAKGNESYMAGLADLLEGFDFQVPTGGNHYTTSGFSHSSADDYCVFHIGWVPADEEIIDAGHANYVFYIYSDGTWAEVTDEVLESESQVDTAEESDTVD